MPSFFQLLFVILSQVANQRLFFLWSELGAVVYHVIHGCLPLVSRFVRSCNPFQRVANRATLLHESLPTG